MVRVTPRRVLAVASLGCLAAGALAAQQRQTRPPAPPSAAPAASQPAPGVIDGAVTDTSLVPILGAEIGILRTTLRVRTGENGRFRFVKVPSGEYLLIVRRLGYRPTSAVVQVLTGDTLRLAYALERVPAELETVVITERRQSLRLMEFEYRRKLGQGEFLTQDQIGRRAALETKDLLRTFKTVDVSPSKTRGSMFDYYAISRRAGGAIQGACPMQVVVDGVPMPSPFNLNLLPSPRELAGIEVYAGAATVPLQFGGLDRRCGMVLVWTRDGY